jgi:putative ABC transport system substrate-binding protein
MRRRALLYGSVAVLAASRVAEAQQAGKVYRIGMLWNTPTLPMQDVLRQGLRELGWIEGQNVLFERRYSEGRNDRHPALAAELVRLQPDLILTAGTPATLAAKAATTTIPVVFVTVADPVGHGLVESFGRPGRNLTGPPPREARNLGRSTCSSSRRPFPRSLASASSSTHPCRCTPMATRTSTKPHDASASR